MAEKPYFREDHFFGGRPLNTSVAECVGLRGERSELQEHCTALEAEHRSQSVREAEQAAQLLDARSTIDRLRGDLRQLRDYQRIAVLLQQVDALPTELHDTDPTPTSPAPEKHDAIQSDQLDIEAHLAATPTVGAYAVSKTGEGDAFERMANNDPSLIADHIATGEIDLFADA